MEVGVAHGSKAMVLRVGNLHASLISIRISLEGSFTMCFRLLMGVSLAIVIILARVMVNL